MALIETNNNLRCFLCSKLLHHMDETRRLQHINNCLDKADDDKTFEHKVETFSNTFDCPMCHKPQPPGPFMVCHIKNCASKHSVPKTDVLALIQAQRQISKVLQNNGLPHTRMAAPKKENEICTYKKRRNKMLPKNVHDEQIQTAIALSLSHNNFDSNIVNTTYVDEAHGSIYGVVQTSTSLQGETKFDCSIGDEKWPAVVRASTEEKLAITESRLFALINERNEVAVSENISAMKFGQRISNENVADGNTDWWSVAGLLI